MRRHASVRRLRVLLLGLLPLVPSCKRADGPATTPTTTASTNDDADTSTTTTTSEPAAPVCPKPYTGTPGTCTYEVDGCCHPDAEQACRAAGCAAARCEILETHPAQIRCRPAADASAAP